MSKTLVKTVPIPESIANDLTHNLTAYKVNMDAYIQVLDSDTAVKSDLKYWLPTAPSASVSVPVCQTALH